MSLVHVAVHASVVEFILQRLSTLNRRKHPRTVLFKLSLLMCNNSHKWEVIARTADVASTVPQAE